VGQVQVAGYSIYIKYGGTAAECRVAARRGWVHGCCLRLAAFFLFFFESSFITLGIECGWLHALILASRPLGPREIVAPGQNLVSAAEST
jgi:hypothetical protein